MSRKILVGIDVGTTVLKAGAFDAETGVALARVSRRLKVDSGPAGKMEQRPADLDEALRGAFAQIRDALGDEAGGIGGIGLAAQGGSATIVDRQTGEAHTALMLWNDTRPLSLLAAIGARKPHDYWVRLSRRDGPGAGLARMVWYRERQPALFADENMYCGAGEYLYFRMTGVWRQDAGNALQVGCYNVGTGEVDPGPLELVDVPESFVAPMRHGHETHGLCSRGAALLGLPEGIPVAGPYMDHEAGYMSALGVSARPLQGSLGTAWVGNFVLRNPEQGSSGFHLALPAPDGQGLLIVQPLLMGNLTWDWGLKTFVDPDHERALIRAAAFFEEALLPPRGLVALPWLTRPNPLDGGAHGGGALFGVSAHTRPEEMLRALVAGMVCELWRVFDDVKDSGLVDCLVLGGGAAKGAMFRKLVAASFAPLPVFALEDQDMAGARGTVYAFSREAGTADAGPIEPAGKDLRAELAAALGLYKKVFERLYGDARMGAAFQHSDKEETR